MRAGLYRTYAAVAAIAAGWFVLESGFYVATGDPAAAAMSSLWLGLAAVSLAACRWRIAAVRQQV